MKIVKLFISSLLLITCYFPVSGAVKTTVKDKKITARTSLKGEAGKKGCDLPDQIKVAAYVYELYHKKPISNQTCASNEWRKVSTIARSENQIDFDGLAPGEYKVVILVGQAKGCDIKLKGENKIIKSIIQQKEESKIIIVKPEPKITLPTLQSISNNTAEGHPSNKWQISIYPNPTAGYLNIDFGNSKISENIQINLINLIGQNIYTNQINGNELDIDNHFRIDVSQFQEGVTLLVVEDESGNREVKKVLIAREKNTTKNK